MLEAHARGKKVGGCYAQGSSVTNKCAALASRYTQAVVAVVVYGTDGSYWPFPGGTFNIKVLLAAL